MKTKFDFRSTLRQAIRDGNKEIIALEKARRACFRAGLGQQTDQITHRLLRALK